MANVCVVPICPPGCPKAEHITLDRYERFQRLAQFATKHRVSADPQQSDFILFQISYSLHLGFLDPWRSALRRHPLLRTHRSKCLVFDYDDAALPFAPGLYTGIDRHWYDHRYHRTGPYIHTDYLWNSELDPQTMESGALHLFSFVGASNSDTCRNQIFRLSHPRGLLQDTSAVSPWQNEVAKAKWQRQFFESVHSSKFVLCPRGRASSSVRLYEVMRAGKVPVIISDAWVPPSGPKWDAFSIRVSEHDINAIPQFLEAREKDAEEMGKAARHAWETWFSKEKIFDRIIDWCVELRDQGHLENGWRSFFVLPHILSSAYQVRRCLLRPVKQRVLRNAALRQIFRAMRPSNGQHSSA